MKKTTVVAFVGVLVCIFWLGVLLGRGRKGTLRIQVKYATPRPWECLYSAGAKYATLVNPLAHPGLIRRSHRGLPTAPCDSLPGGTRKVMGVIDPLMHLMHQYDDMMRRYVGRTEELPHGTPEHVHQFIKGCVWKRGATASTDHFRQFVELPDDAVVGNHIAPPQSEPVDNLGVEPHPLPTLFAEQIEEITPALSFVDPPSAIRDPGVRRAGCAKVRDEYCKLKMTIPRHCAAHISCDT